jgi:hypothetical protein
LLIKKVKMLEQYNLMYPLGKYEIPVFISDVHINNWKLTIDETPTILRNLIDHLTDSALNWKYRPHGWTIAQVVHHMCDSHTNALIRFKLSLTEDTPTIKPYLEGAWAELPDYQIQYLHHSLTMLESVHAKLLVILNHISIFDFHNKSYFHPESHKNYTLGEALGLYDWHCKHHLQHIRQAIEFKNSFLNLK